MNCPALLLSAAPAMRDQRADFDGFLAQHGGWIDVESQKGKGSLFSLYFPEAENTQNAQVHQIVTGVSGKGLENYRILHVEDEDSVRGLTHRVLTGHGHTVIDAESGKNAREIFLKEEGDFHVLVTDVVLGDMNGLDLAEEFLLRKPDLRVIFMSGYMDDRSRKSIITERKFAFLEKPYKAAMLLEMVTRVMGKES